jgi:uncharacterized protein YceK
MKPLALVLILMTGCALTRTVSERDISAAVGRPVEVTCANADGWETNAGRVVVYLSREWAWEPDFYRWGAIACLAADAVDLPRSVVMDRIGIPRQFAYGDAGDTKVDATRMQARLERYEGQSRGTPGWPTFLYK